MPSLANSRLVFEAKISVLDIILIEKGNYIEKRKEVRVKEEKETKSQYLQEKLTYSIHVLYIHACKQETS